MDSNTKMGHHREDHVRADEPIPSTQEAPDRKMEDLQDQSDASDDHNFALTLAGKNTEDEREIKLEFLADVGQEMRTPMNGIIGFASLLGKTPLSVAQREYLGAINKSVTGLLQNSKPAKSIWQKDRSRCAGA